MSSRSLATNGHGHHNWKVNVGCAVGDAGRNRVLGAYFASFGPPLASKAQPSALTGGPAFGTSRQAKRCTGFNPKYMLHVGPQRASGV